MEFAIELAKQTDFSEPLMRVNVDSAARYVGEWDEAAAWDKAAESYRNRHSPVPLRDDRSSDVIDNHGDANFDNIFPRGK
jgi:hypothetical protein